MIAERNREARASWKPLPGPLQDRLWAMLARAAGITTRTAAAELSARADGISHTRVHQQLMLWRDAEPPAVEKRGSGSDQRWHAVPAAVPGMAPGTAAGALVHRPHRQVRRTCGPYPTRERPARPPPRRHPRSFTRGFTRP